MKTIEATVYTFDELDDRAKECARDWYREIALDYGWWEYTYDDAESVGVKIEGFDLDRRLHATGRLLMSGRDVCRAIIAKHDEGSDTYRTAVAHLHSREPFDDDEFLRAILEDYAWLLQKEYEYLLSDEIVDESIMVNGYEFTENGGIA